MLIEILNDNFIANRFPKISYDEELKCILHNEFSHIGKYADLSLFKKLYHFVRMKFQSHMYKI